MEEILALLETASYPRYETLPALLLPHPWPGLGSIGNLASLSRIEEARYPAQNRQLAACLAEARAAEAGIREEWEEAAAHYQTAAENWRSLNRPYDLLRSLTELRKAVSMAQSSSSFHGDIDLLAETQEQSVVLVEQLANQLDEPEARRSFLNSALVKQTLQSQPGKNALRRERQEKIRRE